MNVFEDFAKQKGALIWGRTTFETVKSWDKKYMDSLTEVQKVVISSDSYYQPESGAIPAIDPKTALEIFSK